LKERAEAASKPWYEGLAHLYRGMRLFDEAGSRLESWDYEDAAKLLDKASAAFKEAKGGATGVPRAMRQEQFTSLVEGLTQATDAKKPQGKALEFPLAKGDPPRARAEFSDGVEGYRAPQAAFEKAGYAAGSIAAVRATSTRLRERAAAMERSFSVTRV